jgi:epoxyqueuosine reductase
MTPKLNTKRCLPSMARTEDCAICMKVCPIQRYGVGAVTDSGDESQTR